MTSPKPSRKIKADFNPNGDTFHLLFSNHPISMWVYDLKTLAFLDVNDAALEKYGYTRDEFLKLTIKDIHPADAKHVTRLIDNLEQKRPALQHSGEWSHCLKSGQLIDVEVTTHTLDFEGHKAALVMIQDITERKQAEEALQQSEELLRVILANIHDPVFVTDNDGAFTFICSNVLGALGYSSEELRAMGNISNLFGDVFFSPEELETQKELVNLERSIVDGFGKQRVFLVNVRLVSIGKGTRLFTLHDITERKQVEMELIQSEAKFRSTFDQSPVGSVIVGLDKHFIRCNPAFCNFLGYPESELIGKTISDITHPEDLEIGIKELKQMVEGKLESFTGQKRYIRKDGAVLWGEISIRLVRDANNTPLYFLPIIQNITERKRTEDALKESENRFATIFRANPAAIAMTRLDDGHLVDVNAAWQRLTGYVHTEVVGRTVQELGLWVRPEQRERLMEMLGKQSRAHGEMEFRCKSGETRDLLMSAELIELDGNRYLLTMAQDVTEQKRKDEEIRNAHKRIDSMLKFTTSIISAIPTPFFYKDSEGRFLGVNDAFADLMGYTPDFYVGKTVMELWPDDLAKVYREKDLELMRNPERQVYEFKVMDKDGMIHPVLWGKNVFRDENGQVAGIVGAFVDITERKRAEEALAESEKKFRTLFETMSEGIVYEDHDGKIISANPAAEKLLGLSLNQMQGRTSLDPGWKAIHEDGSPFPGETHSLNVAAKTGKPAAGEVMGIYNPKSGTYVWLSVNSIPEFLPGEKKPFRAYAVFRDITDRKRMDDALRESETVLRTLINAVNESVFLMEPDGKTVAVNEITAARLRVRTVDMIGHNIYSFLPIDVAERRRAYVEQVIATGKPARFEDERFGRWVDNSIYPVMDDTGRVTHLAVYGNDITERKQAENELRESEEKYRQIVDTAGEGIWMIDAEGNTTFANQKMTEMLGYSAGEMLGVSFFTFMDEDGKALAAAKVQRRRQGIKEQYDFKFRRKDGTDLWAILETNPIFDKDGRYAGALAMITDITERKLVEEALRESEVKLQDVFNLMQEGMALNELVFDEQGEIVDYRILEVNPAYERISMLTREQVVGKKATEIYGMSSAYIKEFWRRNQHVVHNIITEYYVPQTNQWRMISTSASVDNKFTTIFSDITERKQAEAKLKESEENFRLIAETIREVFYTYDPLANKFLYVSPAYETLWQEPIQKVYDDSLAFTYSVHADDRERFLAALRREREDGEYFNMQYRIVRPDGTVRYVHSRNYPIFDASGAEYRVVGIAEDITIRKRAEEEILKLNIELEQRVKARTSELREAQEKLVRQEKLAVLGQLAGSVGHELRNPLAVINSALYYLKLIGADSSEKVKEYLGIIQTESRTCEKIITDLLDFARIKSVDVEPVSVSELTERVLERYPVPKTVSLALDIPENLPKLYVDLRQMEQVLGNLVLNACQSMSTGGESTGGGLVITARQEQEMVSIAVQDTGVGIPPENMKKLFEPLFTTKAKGVGLGLAVSLKLVEANGGRIEVQSEAGMGSAFTVYLPVKK